MSFCTFGDPYVFKSFCENDCGVGWCQMNANQDYCCTLDLSGIDEGLNTLASILIGVFVGGGLFLLLSIIGCYFCCCRPSRQSHATVIVRGGQQQMQPISILPPPQGQLVGNQINQISMPSQ
ncbi:Hypothetical_protein [Hexamita inflata]|uniref:Hypothetical_protein n=1 Tax=Hexamita inflata TaxID=28002 RepID=A0AA86RCV6_9EUKA|nr:Hypothetical protein HINF_LOCUS63511 [Hexamita inflata]CAI9975869.1 Hypothetical protein HINF_LOCUS63514 [Hexamita inflata]